MLTVDVGVVKPMTMLCGVQENRTTCNRKYSKHREFPRLGRDHNAYNCNYFPPSLETARNDKIQCMSAMNSDSTFNGIGRPEASGKNMCKSDKV